MKLPWTTAREQEAQAWVERSFGEAPPACAARVARLLSECVTDDLEHLSADQLLSDDAEFTELRRIELFLALEREFGLSISEDDAEHMKTPAEIISCVAGHEPAGTPKS